MRLINTSNYQLEMFSSISAAPEYAVLSHTWGPESEEVSFDDMTPDITPTLRAKKFGFIKIEKACQLAQAAGIKYVWVDTCCINKSSSAELSEAINSMFTLYRQSKVCLAFLLDWEAANPTFDECRWWKRGWTLQELLAPPEVSFYDKSWNMRGTKSTLQDDIARVSGISQDVLSGQTALAHVPVAVRMSWASERTTTRKEDEAYCLLGIFDINMAMLYGEGPKAFQRLQRKIIKDHTDMSIFAWRALPDVSQEYMGVLAPSPREFIGSKLYPTQLIELDKLTKVLINRYVEVELPVTLRKENGQLLMPVYHYDLRDGSLPTGPHISYELHCYAVALHVVEENIVARANPCHLYYYSFQNDPAKPLELKIFKYLSISDSNACSRKVLWITCPSPLNHPDLGLEHHDGGYWKTEMSEVICATQRTRYVNRLHFKPEWCNEFSSFGVVCRFQNPAGYILTPGYWECDVFQADELVDLHEGGYIEDDNDYPLTSRHDAPTVLKKVLEIQHRDGGPQRKRVELTLKREHYATGAVRFSMSVAVTNVTKEP